MQATMEKATLSRATLIAALNEDLAREYQSIISYVVYSQKIKGAEYMTIAKELETHAREELEHALIVAKQIDYLGGELTVEPAEVRTSGDAQDMLGFDLQNEAVTLRAYRERVRQAEVLGEFALAEQLRKIIVQEQDHLIELATALGIEAPDTEERDPTTKRV